MSDTEFISAEDLSRAFSNSGTGWQLPADKPQLAATNEMIITGSLLRIARCLESFLDPIVNAAIDRKISQGYSYADKQFRIWMKQLGADLEPCPRELLQYLRFEFTSKPHDARSIGRPWTRTDPPPKYHPLRKVWDAWRRRVKRKKSK